MKDYSSKVELAHEIARKAHKGQVDKAGADYIAHPEYVAAHVEKPEEKIVAYLHDVLEDTDYPEVTLREQFGDEIMDALLLLTHKDEDDYFDYVRKVKTNPIAAAVKASDLRHNSQIDRIPHPTQKDYQRLEKYRKALSILEAK